MRLDHVLLVIRLVEILAFHFLVKIIIGNTLENWDLIFECLLVIFSQFLLFFLQCFTEIWTLRNFLGLLLRGLLDMVANDL